MGVRLEKVQKQPNLLPFNSSTNWRHFSPGYRETRIGVRAFLGEYIDINLPTILFVDGKCMEKRIDARLNICSTFEINNEPTRKELVNLLSKIENTTHNVVAIGGGSTIDMAKAFTAARTFDNYEDRIGYEKLKWTNNYLGATFDKLLAVPTTLGSGSETSRYFVLFENDGLKKPSRTWQAIPQITIYDSSEFNYLTAVGAKIQLFDSWTHAFEENSPQNFLISEPLISKISRVLNLADIKALSPREINNFQVYSSMAGTCISNTRTGALHTVGEALSRYWKIPHVWTLHFAGLNYELLMEGKYRESENGECSLTQSAIEKYVQNDLSEFRKYFENQPSHPKGLNLKHKLEEIKEMVLSDRVLWDKEHPYHLSDEQITSYLERTILSVSTI